MKIAQWPLIISKQNWKKGQTRPCRDGGQMVERAIRLRLVAGTGGRGCRAGGIDEIFNLDEFKDVVCSLKKPQ